MLHPSSAFKSNPYQGTSTYYQTSTTNEGNNQLRVSRLDDHHWDRRTDKLYDPLRDVLLHPKNVLQHSRVSPHAAHNSHLTQDYRFLSQPEITNIKNRTFIPVNKQLKPTYDCQKVRNNKWMVIDAQERVTGRPIDQYQMQTIRKSGVRQERILYDFEKEEIKKTYAQQPPIQIKRQVEPTTKYTPPVLNSSDSKPQYKYNLYSSIDEPVNMCRQKGCGMFGCPGNEIIASRNKPQTSQWFK